MKSQKINNLFLSQSYIDSWDEYKNSLEKEKQIKWDYIILTASNEEQAQTYRMQIDERIKEGFLPDSIHYAVLPDPDGKRVGSGGATFNVLKYIKNISGNASFERKRILVIHSGGDSKRVPQYSACGKLFSPVPRLLPDGRHSTLFDEFIISMSGVAPRIKSGMMVLSGDVLLLFNFLQIDFYSEDAAAISIKENVETGKNHGVFHTDKNGNVLNFLHKNSVENLMNMGAVNEQGNVDLDTGAIIMSSRMIEDLYSLVDTEEKFREFVDEKSRISFYADFLYPLAKESTLEKYYEETPEGDFTPELKKCREKIWTIMHKYTLKMISLSPAQFIHFGTTKELLNLLTKNISEFEFLDWSGRIITNKDNCGQFAAINSLVDNTAEIPESCYIENSLILGKTKIGKNCVISNMVLDGENVEDDTVLHGLKLKNGKFVVRKYKIDTNPKVNNFWNENVFFESDSLKDSLDNKGENKTSLFKSFNEADTKYIIEWEKELEEKIRIHNFIYDIKNHITVNEAMNNFGDKGITESIAQKLVEMAENESPETKSRIYYYISKSSNLPLLGKGKEDYEQLCFETIQNIILEDSLKKIKYSEKNKIKKDEVTVTLPVRVNFGGGWSDTPPYCNENGGTVLNVAIKLNGIEPVVVKIKKTERNVVEFESEDSGVYGTVDNISDIVECSNPYEPFALHKAALVACGVIPRDSNMTLEERLKELGGGIYLSTQVIGIPRGSGLGTSSILSAACVKAIAEFMGEEISDDEIYYRVMCMEQIMSTGGGWQDQIGGLKPGLKLLTSKKGITQNIKVEEVEISEETKKELGERFVLIYTGQRRLARNLLREVVGKYISGDKTAIDVLEKIQRLAVLMKFELEKGNVDAFAKLLTEHWELSKKLDSGCTNTCIDQIFASIENLIDGKFISGAGGGGFLQVILKKDVSKAQLREKLRSVFQDSGIDVWETDFVF